MRSGRFRRIRVQALLSVLAMGAWGAVACLPRPETARDRPVPTRADPPTIRSSGPAAFEGDFESRLRAGGPDARWTALVDLDTQVDLDALGRALSRSGLAKRERRERVIDALERVAEASQRRLAPALDAEVAAGGLDYWRGFAVVNRVLVEGKARGILALASVEGVHRILPDWTSARTGRLDATLTPGGAPLPDRFRSWAVVATGAARLWDRGIDGSGVVIASIDTGVLGAHEQLAGRMLPPPRGWYDPVEGTSVPTDAHGHGTSVLSVAAGGNPGDRIVGMAPGARWASALGNWKNYYSRSRMTQAADWILRVARPDVLVNAWSHDEDGGCTTFDLPFVRAWQAAEIFVVFPAGNAGPAPRTGESPAQLDGGYPDGGPLFSVGALAPDGTVPRLSSRGPSRCGSPSFPSVAAPGADLPYAFAGDPKAYASGQGTSLAAGVVAGAAALLLQAAPEASPDEVGRALAASARDLPPAGTDPASGTGAIDVPAALDLLRRKERNR
jgi:bacillopeptidase F